MKITALLLLRVISTFAPASFAADGFSPVRPKLVISGLNSPVGIVNAATDRDVCSSWSAAAGSESGTEARSLRQTF